MVKFIKGFYSSLHVQGFLKLYYFLGVLIQNRNLYDALYFLLKMLTQYWIMYLNGVSSMLLFLGLRF